MWRAVKENVRLSGKANLMAALPAAVVTTLLSGLTITANIHFSAYLALGLLHFVVAYLFIATLWLPLTWFRKRFLHSQNDLILAVLLPLPVAAAFCLIVPYNLITFLFSAVEARLVEATIICFHLLCAFIFIWSLGKMGRPRVVLFRKGAPRSAADLPAVEEKIEAGEAPFRPRLLLGAVSFIIGLYFVIIFEWWMVNLKLTVSRDDSIRHRSVSAKVEAILAPDSTNFQSLPKFFQPYKSIAPLQELKRPREHPYQFHHRIVQRRGEDVELYLRRSSLAMTAHLQQWPVMPPDSLSEASSRSMQATVGSLLPVISITLSGAFLLFLGGIVPLRLMGFVLPAVWHNEIEYRKRLLSTVIYTKQFYLALLVQNPLFSIAGLLVWLLVAVPLLVFIGGKLELLTAMVGPDQILFTFAALAAWLNPVVYGGVYVDRTFGLYFNTRLANLILGVRGHVVVFGFGYLGQRVVDREMLKIDRRQARRKSTRFEKIVSPELDVEDLCSHFIIVDRDVNNFLFATTSDALGNYGVVAALENALPGPEPLANENRHISPPRQRRRVLVPIVQGDATEPFTLSRVNLQRASFLISTISQEERIHEVFDRAAETGLRSIICVSRSDQMVNLTYKAVRHPITFVYPKQDSGMALGQRLVSAVLKVSARLPENQIAPRIMVVGLNKSNYFMLKTLWHNWPVVDVAQRTKIFADMLRFVITSEDDAQLMPRLSNTRATSDSFESALPADGDLQSPPASNFTRLWHTSFIMSFRHYQTPKEERPLYFRVPTCVMKADEAGVLERCLDEFRPDILVINEDNADKSLMILLRAINSLERLKYEKESFRLPLILMRTARSDEFEQKDIGDAFRFYDALTRLYQDQRGPLYPRHAYFRRQIPRRLVGNNTHDGLADTEEIISSIRDNWERAAEGRSQIKPRGTLRDATPSTPGEAFELNTCLPNTAGVLAELTARLAGLEFSNAAQEPIKTFFQKMPGQSDGNEVTILRPSFQYIRHLKLEVPGRGFCLTGYADLQEDTLADIAREDLGELDAIATRVYAKDERNYLNKKQADPACEDHPVPRLLTLTRGKTAQPLHTQTFVEVMMGSQDGQTTGETFCPGMTICPIASYQHYVVASNGREIDAWQRRKENLPLRDAPNYGCTKLNVGKNKSDQFPRYARIFCCCHAQRDDPGLIAVVLNLLNFQRFTRLYRRAARERNLEKDWVVNIEYFKDVSCQNRFFALNRLFGARRYTKDMLQANNWTMDDYEKRLQGILPITLLQIMPSGGPQQARRWFDYALALYRYLCSVAPPPREFCFHWRDQNEQYQEKQNLAPGEEEYPIVIQINNRPQAREEGCCKFCGVSDPDMSRGCAMRQPWMGEDR